MQDDPGGRLRTFDVSSETRRDAGGLLASCTSVRTPPPTGGCPSPPRNLGVEYISADPDPESFDDLDKLVESFGIAVGIHTTVPEIATRKIETIARAIKDHHPR